MGLQVDVRKLDLFNQMAKEGSGTVGVFVPDVAVITRAATPILAVMVGSVSPAGTRRWRRSLTL